MTCPVTLHLGVYALGAADVGERRLVEAHLPGCAACQRELAQLAPLPRLLASVPADLLTGSVGAPSGCAPGAPVRPGRARPVPGRRLAPSRTPVPGLKLASGRRAVSAAVAVAAAAAGLAAGLWLGQPHRAPARALPAARPAEITLSGANRATHVQAMAVLTATSWGSRIELRVRGLPLNVTCRLIVRSRDGQREVSGVWDAWQAEPVTIPGSVGWLPSDIASLQVVTASGSLLTMPAAQSPAAGQQASAGSQS